MTKQEILDEFDDINFVYNNSSKHETLSWMLDELLKEQEAVHVKKQEPVDPVLDYWRANFGSHYKCGNCGSSLGYIYESRFCKRCGREVNWGD